MKFSLPLVATLVLVAGCSLSPAVENPPEPTDANETADTPFDTETVEPSSNVRACREPAGREPFAEKYISRESLLDIKFGDMLAGKTGVPAKVPAGEIVEYSAITDEEYFAPDDSDISSDTPSLELLSFNGGGRYRGGEKHQVVWKAAGINQTTADIYVEFYDGRGWSSLWRGDPADGRYEWTIPAVNCENCRIRIVADDGQDRLTAESEVSFVVDSMPPVADIVIDFSVPVPEAASPPSKAPAYSPEEEAVSTSARIQPPAAEPKPVAAKVPSPEPESVEEQTALRPTGDDAKALPPKAEYPERGNVEIQELVVDVEIEKSVSIPSTQDVPEAAPAASGRNDDTIKEMVEGADLDMCYTLGTRALDEKRYERAVEWLRKYIEMEPDNTEVLFALGMAYFYAARYPESEEMLSLLVTIETEHAGAYYYLGKISLKSEVYSDSDKQLVSMAAKQRFSKAFSLNPNYAAAYNDLGKVYFDEDNTSKALVLFEKAVGIEANNKLYLYNAGRAAYSNDDYHSAIEYCLKAVKISPSFCYPYWFVAKSYSELEKWSEAALYWEKVVDLFSFNKRMQAEALRELHEAQRHLD